MTDLTWGLALRKTALAVAAAVAVCAAIVLLFFAAFPYVFAESGSQSYARAHRGEAFAQVVAAVALLWVAWWCARRSLSLRSWAVLVVLLIVAGAFASHRAARAVPAGLQPIGGGWHVTTEHRPAEIDTVMYSLYHERNGRYESIESQVSEYRFVPPDCVLFRGLIVVGRPMYAMCGYRIPVETFDTATTEADLLAEARNRPGYRSDWRYNR